MDLRNYFLGIRRLIPASYKKAASEKILYLCQKIIEERKPKVVALFCAMKEEPNIFSLFQDRTIRFVVPKVVSDTQMKMFEIRSIEDLQEGTFGILEPKKECPEVLPGDIDIIFVPAVSLDLYGNRIGMGKGYYDRYLSKCPAYKVGVVFSEQISNKAFVPKSWDVPMDAIIAD